MQEQNSTPAPQPPKEAENGQVNPNDQKANQAPAENAGGKKAPQPPKEAENFPFDPSWKGCVIVEQSQNIPGFGVKDPSTIRQMPYEVDVFERLLKTEGFKGYNVEILHDPRKK